jgi:PAS domain S-box-containing protein
MTLAFPRPRRVALLLWLVGLVLSGLLAAWTHSANQRLLAERLAFLSDEVATLVRERIGLYEYGLRGARGAVVAAGGSAVTRDAFAAYIATRDLAREFPGALGFGFIRRVARADEASFLAAARADGPASFSLRELDEHDGERFVIQYIYPLEQNQGATGLDVASERSRRAAAEAAARTGRATITAPLTLVQANAQPRGGFLVFLPIHAAGARTHTSQASELAVIGWAYAPLRVDHVLAGLGQRMQQIGIRLTDSAESTPFFDSMPPGTAVMAGVPAVTREITVFGRRWLLQAHALPALAAAARPTSVAWVAGGSAVVSTLLALLLGLALQRREEHHKRLAPSQPMAGEPVSLRRFLRSPQLRWALLGYLVFLALSLALGHRAEWSRQLNAARAELVALVDERVVGIRTAQSARRKALTFLAEVPPVLELARVLPSGSDPTDGSLRKIWEMRLHQILSAHLRASPEVYRARLIGVADGGRELMRVERRGSEIVVVPPSELELLGNHPDVREALRLHAAEVWVSELDLNLQSCGAPQPDPPTIRYATPVFRPDGQAFGVLMVHVDVADRLVESAGRAPRQGALHVTSDEGVFLTPCDVGQGAGNEPARPLRWTDVFRPAKGPAELRPDDRLQVWLSDRGRVLAATAAERPNPNSAVGTIRFSAVVPLARVEAAVWRALGIGLLVPLSAGVAALLLLYFYWASVQRQLQVQLHRLHLAAIVEQSMDAIVALDAAHRVTAWNRGAERLFGIDRQRAFGQELFGLIGAGEDAHSLLDAAQCADSWQVGEFACRGSDGRVLQVAMTRSRLSDAHGAVTSAILRDVTEERVAKQRVEELNLDLAQRLGERTEMIDVLAHEVRQPLHNASAALESARCALDDIDGAGPEDALVRAQAVLLEVQRCLDNTLAVASLLARPGPIHLDDADVDTLISVAIADLPFSERSRIRVERETTTRTVLMDTSLMRLALRNLLSNAVRFSPPDASVRVRVADCDAPLALIIDVIDRGPGISQAMQARLFSRGARGCSPRAGHGLGLYIVRQVMKLHGAQVELVDTGPQGSTFRLTIIQDAADA